MNTRFGINIIAFTAKSLKFVLLSVINVRICDVLLNFLASRDECPGSLCHNPTVGAASASALAAWTKTLTLAITFKP